MRKSWTILAALSAVLMAGLISLPAGVAGASPMLWVSNTAAIGADSSCASPGYATIQSAINAATPGQTIEVCSGTYVEQLTIQKALTLVGVGSVTVELPATPANSTTACDTAINAYWSGIGQDEIDICGPGASAAPTPTSLMTVKITGLNVQALWPSGTCNDGLYGVLVEGGATLDATNVAIDGAGAVPINGCQGGLGIQVGFSIGTPYAQAGFAKLSHVTVSGYQKNGITVDGTDASAKITGSFVTGAGATPAIAQNGIQISDGAKGTIKSSTISGNECDDSAGGCGPSGLQVQSAGVLFYGAARGSLLQSSSISGNDMGVYYVSLNPTAPASAEVTLKSNTFNANRYEGVELDQGFAALKGNLIEGTGEAGIQVIQYSGQSYGDTSTATTETIEDQTVAAVQILSDQTPGDFPGVFTISHSHFLAPAYNNAAAESNNSSNYLIGGTGNN